MMQAAPLPPSNAADRKAAVSSPSVRAGPPTNSNDDDMFSPTSAAALALSTLHHFGAERDNRRMPPSALKGTRLFIGNGGSTHASTNSSNSPGTISINASSLDYRTLNASPDVEHPSNTAANAAPTTSTVNDPQPPPMQSSTTLAPVGTPYASYPSASPPSSATVYIPTHRHHHGPPPHPPPQARAPIAHPFHAYHADPRYTAWRPQQHAPPQPQQQAPHPPPPPPVTHASSEVSQRQPSPLTTHWTAAASYAYPTPQARPAGVYSIDNRPPSRGATPSNVGPSPPSSRSSSICGQESMYYHSLAPRASPVGFGGPSPPLSRSNSFIPHLSSASAELGPGTAEKPHLVRLAPSTPLVTPTPKRPKMGHRRLSNASTSSNSSASNSNQAGSAVASSSTTATAYSRKKKSLGVLAENFLKTYQALPQGSTVVVDEAAAKLGVERRRIYDVVNILESICLVCKKHKNTYSWMGMDHLDAVFGRLQAQAIEDYPEDAKKLLGVMDVADMNGHLSPVPVKRARKHSKTRENKSLAKLSQEFLQVFLVGHETLSLPEASDKIQGTTSMEELIALGHAGKDSNNNSSTGSVSNGAAQTGRNEDSEIKESKSIDEKELKAAAARGLKTKIRRLYDIANVFLSVGLLRKVDSTDTSRRPNFSWSYRLTPKALYDLHRPHKDLSRRENKMVSTNTESSLDLSSTPKAVSPSGALTQEASPPSSLPCSSTPPCGNSIPTFAHHPQVTPSQDSLKTLQSN